MVIDLSLHKIIKKCNKSEWTTLLLNLWTVKFVSDQGNATQSKGNINIYSKYNHGSKNPIPILLSTLDQNSYKQKNKHLESNVYLLCLSIINGGLLRKLCRIGNQKYCLSWMSVSWIISRRLTVALNSKLSQSYNLIVSDLPQKRSQPVKFYYPQSNDN